MTIEPVLKLAIALHESPGVYALLVGSGVSRAAGIPTGWDVVLDLIRKIAAASGEDPEPDPEAWYSQKFGEEAHYAKLLSSLTTTPAERAALLSSYFEPTEQEREDGLKIPTPAHIVISRLVHESHVRLIVTTNFDRLIEGALEAEGIQPNVISSEDDLKGAMPLVHSRCVVVKLHGDYRDTRIRNTAEELARYAPRLNKFLDRVLDEFGLVVCGWSAAYDVALSEAILRAPNRRFTTFWLARGDLSPEAEQLIEKRRAEVISIEGADQFFAGLEEKIQSLRELDRPHPPSTAAAVESVKRYVGEPQHEVRLHDLLHEETESLHAANASERFQTHDRQATIIDGFQGRMRAYEALSERLEAMVAALAYYGKGDNASLLTRTLNRLSRPNRHEGFNILLGLQYYPALLVTYAAGISALSADRFGNLAAILHEPECTDGSNRDRKPVLALVNANDTFAGVAQWIPRPNADKLYTPVSEHLLDLLRPVLRPYVPDPNDYEEMFDVFEYLLALTHADLIRPATIGRFGWRIPSERTSVSETISGWIEQASDCGLLKAGFFDGSPTRFREVFEAYEEWRKEITQGWR